MITESVAYLRQWITTTLDTKNPVFNDLPACPYARKALIDGKVTFLHCDVPMWDEIREWAMSSEVIVVVVHTPMSVPEFHFAMEEGNRILAQSGLIGLEDHPDYPEEVGGVVLNNGRYQIMLIQAEAALEKARARLEKLGYYKNWPADYREEVTGRKPNPPCSD